MRGFATVVPCLLFGFLGTTHVRAATGVPVWRLSVTALPTNLSPGAGGSPQGYVVFATNVGGADSDGEIVIADELPMGLSLLPGDCEANGQLVRCSHDEVVHPGEFVTAFIQVSVDPALAGDRIENTVTLEGGGGAAVAASVETQVGASAPAFGFLAGASGLAGVLNAPDGTAVTRAGSTPSQLTIGFGFPTASAGSQAVNAGDPRDVAVDLPPGLAFDPAAVPRCGEGQLMRGACPPASEIGRADVVIILPGGSEVVVEGGPLYNMVPPPGFASNFGFESGANGFREHLLGSIRAGEYGLSAEADDILAKYLIAKVQLQLWGYPPDPVHDALRGGPTEPLPRPLITLPSACGPLGLAGHTDSWQALGSFVSRATAMEDLGGNALEVEDCSRLEFAPTLSVRPTTQTADSPGGLDLKVDVPQRISPNGATTSSLRDVTVVLAPGLVINPAAADGLTACTLSEVGLVSAVGRAQAQFDSARAECPDSSKLGLIEASTPLLQDEVEGGGLAAHPLKGGIYLAQPRQNPFGSEFALYGVIEDAETGTVAKLAGEVRANPLTGQLTTTLEELPQLPFEEFKLEFFEGPRGLFRTPATCGVAASRGTFTPWSGTSPVPAEGRFSILSGPGGGECVATTGGLPNAPRLTAGTTAPVAGAYKPFILDLSRADGSQEFGALNLMLPTGLTAKLAGVASCSDAALAAARGKTGAEEQANPSCPGPSQVGRVVVALGAGSHPFQAGGKVYLAGPYKGAPLSLAAVTPAAIGPFDLGTVVVRAAVFVDPVTARVSVRSDSLPSVVGGVPLDIRSLRLELDKSGLIRNPTSCDPTAVDAEAMSVAGDIALIRSRFQVGNCGGLPFKPKPSLRLSAALRRNGHPALRATLRTNPSGAALAGATFMLPQTELLDLRHVPALCPRALAVGQCPSNSRLGSLRLESPLVEGSLDGPVYLRVPRRGLPGLEAEVSSGSLTFMLSGRTVSTGGHLGVRLESLPDIPLSGAVLNFAGGRRGILVNSRSLCRKRDRVTASFSAHNGMRRQVRTPVVVTGCKKP
jgi:hypothetical protein